MEEIKDYNKIKNEFNANLLLGNGFSRHFDSRFHYDSLFETCKDKYFSKDDIKIFQKFNTSDFEIVLRMLYFSSELGSAVINESIEEIEGINKEVTKYNEFIISKYGKIRDSLISAIKDGHITYEEICEGFQLEIIKKSIHRFDKVFTLNYDLLPYWATMSNSSKFVDFFFGTYFDLSQTDIFPGKKAIYYLHGSLYLYQESLYEYGRVGKICSYGEGLLNRLSNLFEDGRVPLFVSEGTSEQKKKKIYSNSYLSFCSNSLKNIDGTLTIFGWAFAEQDQHIIDLINNNEENITKIAISIFTGNGEIPENEITKLVRSIKSKLHNFHDSKITFFDSETFWETIEDKNKKNLMFGNS